MKPFAREIPTVILAGGRNRIPLFDGYAPPYKALLRYADKSSLKHVLQTLNGVARIGRISIVGPEDALRREIPQIDVHDLLPEGDSMIEGVVRGLQRFKDEPWVLFVTGDLPLLTSEAVNDFLCKVSQVDSIFEENLFVSFVPKHFFRGAYRRVHKGFIRFKDVSACHGNLAMLDPRLRHHKALARSLDKLYRSRKHAVKAALSFGFASGLAYLFGVHLFHLLTLEQMAGILSRRLGVGVIPIVMEHPEITVDVDEPEDYAFVKEQLEEGSNR